MRVFKTKTFNRGARKAGVADAELGKSVARILAGKIDADLGAHLVKQRVSQGEGGRTGGHRAIIVHKYGDRIVFVHLFAKSARANLTGEELETYRDLAKIIADLAPSKSNACSKPRNG
ncbi:type II toxin-antitoxin system RelE/ParE family toxin [Aurantimonas sp. A3-2-R12]|uniref:type II toxin-antitoxin system RelE/ParE family toxin n=1 Tax=Aurantimonas sp. A3-2-R12 TaxID=3114362 RepID=UPI002E19C02F|nr:type II toxin-antitoxin system RelE/ParE family toxin [Aurantimonas sp. A3-2-R12]